MLHQTVSEKFQVILTYGSGCIVLNGIPRNVCSARCEIEQLLSKIQVGLLPPLNDILFLSFKKKLSSLNEGVVIIDDPKGIHYLCCTTSVTLQQLLPISQSPSQREVCIMSSTVQEELNTKYSKDVEVIEHDHLVKITWEEQKAILWGFVESDLNCAKSKLLHKVKSLSKVQRPLDSWQEGMSTSNNKVPTTVLDIEEPLPPPISLDPSLEVLLISSEENSKAKSADFSVESSVHIESTLSTASPLLPRENLSEIHVKESTESDDANQSRHSTFGKSPATVVVSNLHPTVTVKDILTLLQPYGTVINHCLYYDSGQRSNQVMVMFSDVSSAFASCQVNGLDVAGQQIQVKVIDEVVCNPTTPSSLPCTADSLPVVSVSPKMIKVHPRR